MNWKWTHHLPLSLFTLLMPGIVMIYLLSYTAHYNMGLTWVFAMGFGLSIATLHLGRPRGAMQALRHVYRSWLSREMVFFTLMLFGLILQLLFPALATMRFWHILISLTGILGVVSTMMVYQTSRRIGHWPVIADFLLEMIFFGAFFLPHWFYLIVGLKVAKDLYLSSILWSDKDSRSLLTAALSIFVIGIAPADHMTSIFFGVVNALLLRLIFFKQVNRDYLNQMTERHRMKYLPAEYRKYFQRKG